MGKISTLVGLDYHDETIRVCVMGEDGEMLFNSDMKNDAQGIAELIGAFGTPEGVAIEACCGASNFATELRRISDWNVRQAHPGYVANSPLKKCATGSASAFLNPRWQVFPHWPSQWHTRMEWSIIFQQAAKLKQCKDKTDFGDARLLADLLRVGFLPEVWLPDLDTRQLRKLVRFRQRLVRDRKDVKLRMRSVLRDDRIKCEDARPWTRSWMEWVKTVALPEQSRWVIDRLLQQLERLNEDICEVEQQLADDGRK